MFLLRASEIILLEKIYECARKNNMKLLKENNPIEDPKYAERLRDNQIGNEVKKKLTNIEINYNSLKIETVQIQNYLRKIDDGKSQFLK